MNQIAGLICANKWMRLLRLPHRIRESRRAKVWRRPVGAPLSVSSNPQFVAFYSALVIPSSRKSIGLNCKEPSGPLVALRQRIRGMKRKASESQASAKTKRARETEPDYCDAECQRDEHDSIVWPASRDAVESARSFLKEWYGNRWH